MRSCQKKPGDLSRRAARSCFVPAALMLAGCERYQSMPLVPEEIAASVSRARAFPDGETDAGIPLTFERAAGILARHGPALKEAKAAYETSLAVAKIKTPLPNPSVEAGFNFGSGSDAESRATQPFGAIGFTIPTGRRLRRQDELNRARAELARVEWILKHRESYLTLRDLYSDLTLSRKRLQELGIISDSAADSSEKARRWAALGQIAVLEAQFFSLEASQAKTEHLSGEEESIAADAQLSRLLGVDAGYFKVLPAEPLPKFPEDPPAADRMKNLMIVHHPELARLRASYSVAERELRLEIARQYPDFQFGPSFSKEVGEDKQILGLTLGAEIPLFDRNQQAIAAAEKRREEVRIQYEAVLNRALGTLDEVQGRALFAIQKQKIAQTALTQARENSDLARRSLQAGLVGPLHLLEAERSRREATKAIIETEQKAWGAWFDLEQAVGCPLVAFPGEEPAGLPSIPESAGGEK